MLGACATGEDEDALDTEGRAEVAVSILEDAVAATDDTGTATGSAEGSASDADSGSATGSAEGSTVATLSGVAAEVTGGPAEMSTDLGRPADARGFLAVDSAYSTDLFEARNDLSDDIRPTAGNTLVVIDYQLYWNPGGNFFDEAVRLIVDGTTYSPAHHINELGGIGEVLNWVMVFEVPAGVTEAHLEAGVPEGTAGGVTAGFDLRFDPSLPLPEQASGPVTPAEGTVSGGPAPAILNTDYFGGEATVSVDAVRITDRSGEVFASEGTQLVEADVTLVGTEGGRGNVMGPAFRLRADDEWYSMAVNINDIMEFGQTFEYTLVFEVPIGASEYQLEVGAPAAWSSSIEGYQYEYSDQPTASFDLVF